MSSVCQRPSNEVWDVAIDPVDLERVEQELIVHLEMLAHPRVIAALRNHLSPEERQIFLDTYLFLKTEMI